MSVKLSDVTTTSPSPVADRRTTARRVLIGIIAALLIGNIAATIYVVNFCAQPVPGYYRARLVMIIIAGVLAIVASRLRPSQEA